MTNHTATEALAALGISSHAAIEVDQSEKQVRSLRDNRVCLCGHPVSRHKVDPYSGILTCKPSQLLCRCKSVRPVLTTNDTRLFLRRTTGAGLHHALVRGLAACAQVGKEVAWIEPPQCERCKTLTGNIAPVVITSYLKVVPEVDKDSDTGLHAMLCDTCIKEL